MENFKLMSGTKTITHTPQGNDKTFFYELDDNYDPYNTLPLEEHSLENLSYSAKPYNALPQEDEIIPEKSEIQSSNIYFFDKDFENFFDYLKKLNSQTKDPSFFRKCANFVIFLFCLVGVATYSLIESIVDFLIFLFFKGLSSLVLSPLSSLLFFSIKSIVFSLEISFELYLYLNKYYDEFSEFSLGFVEGFLNFFSSLFSSNNNSDFYSHQTSDKPIKPPPPLGEIDLKRSHSQNVKTNNHQPLASDSGNKKKRI